MRRAVAAIAVGVALATLALPAGASAQALLAQGDAVDLAQSLADAQAEQGVCYGWAVTGSVSSQGSSTGGPDVPLQPDSQACPRGAIVFQASVVYECASCDGGDQVAVQINSTLPNPPTPRELEDLGYEPGELAGDKDDQALVDMVGALPLLVAEHGVAAPVALESPESIPATDRPTNSPGSDVVRTAAPLGALAILLILSGLGWFVYKRGQHRREPPSTS